MTVQEWSEQALFAQAAYSHLTENGEPETLKSELVSGAAGMTADQAERFAETFEVVKQENDPTTGLSVTVFKLRGDDSADGARFLAVRGTESPGRGAQKARPHLQFQHREHLLVEHLGAAS